MSGIIKTIETNINEIVSNCGYELYDLELVKEGENTFLRVYIESLTDTKIMIEDCLKVNSSVSKYLDTEDPIKEAYMLEVSSPGIIRRLKTKSHYERQIGSEILVKFNQKLDGFDSKQYNGVLQSVTDEKIVIDEKEIAFENIKKAETTFKF